MSDAVPSPVGSLIRSNTKATSAGNRKSPTAPTSKEGSPPASSSFDAKTARSIGSQPMARSQAGGPYMEAKPPPSVLTTVRRKTVERNWKRRALSYFIYLIALVTMIVAVSAVVARLQTVQNRDEKRYCAKLKEIQLNEFDDICADKTSPNDCSAAQRRMFETLGPCYSSRDGKPKPANNMARAMMYAFSTFSTIGYGNVAAKSTATRIFTVVYAVIGIALFWVFLNQVGKLFHLRLLQAYEHVRRYTGAGKNFVFTTTSSEDSGIFAFALAIYVLYLCLVAAFYTCLEGWSYWVSFYFSYMSMSLVGFGDVYPGTDSPPFIMAHITVTTIGIVLLALCFFSLKQWWSRIVERVASRITSTLVRVPQTAPFAPQSGPSILATAAPIDDDSLNDISVSFSTDVALAGRSPRSPARAKMKRTLMKK